MTFEESQHPRTTSGQFTNRPRSLSEVSLTEDMEAMFVREGDEIAVDLQNPDSPFHFAMSRFPDFRAMWSDAGSPESLTVLRRGRDRFEPSDVLVTFQVGDGEYELSFHRERVITVAGRN